MCKVYVECFSGLGMSVYLTNPIGSHLERFSRGSPPTLGRKRGRGGAESLLHMNVYIS